MSIKLCRVCGKGFEYVWKSRNYICPECNNEKARKYRAEKTESRELEFLNTDPSFMRKCCSCKEEKSLVEFSKNKYASRGHTYYCFPCNRRINKEKRDSNRIEHNIKKRLSFFKITRDEYEGLFERANNLCEICGTNENASSRPLGIDHCHATGKVRGILCNKCNWLIGSAQDRIDLLEKGIQYLKSRQTQ